MTLKELAYKLLMLSEQEEFNAQLEQSLSILNDVCDTTFTLEDVVNDDNRYQRVGLFLSLDTKLRLNDLELFGSTLVGVQRARNNALENCQIIFTQE